MSLRITCKRNSIYTIIAFLVRSSSRQQEIQNRPRGGNDAATQRRRFSRRARKKEMEFGIFLGHHSPLSTTQRNRHGDDYSDSAAASQQHQRKVGVPYRRRRRKGDPMFLFTRRIEEEDDDDDDDDAVTESLDSISLGPLSTTTTALTAWRKRRSGDVPSWHLLM